MSVYVIAEAGVNHNGRLDLAKKLVDAAKDAGADCVKFQTFISSNLVSKWAGKAEYQKQQTDADESQLDMLKKLELSFEDFIELKDYCSLRDIEFLSTAFDNESIDFLDKISMSKWKIPSGEITNLPYLVKIAKFNKPIILSTGMSTMDEIERAVLLLKENGSGEITLLHCTTEYPTPYSEINLQAMLSIEKRFKTKIGYSDHSKGVEIPVAAVALGATVIEKHFTLDRNMEGPDHKASLEPDELKAMVDSIRHVESALGDGIKKPSISEGKNINIVRKSIVAKQPINKGELITESMLTTKRPGNGISPMSWYDVIGKRAIRDFDEDEMIEL